MIRSVTLSLVAAALLLTGCPRGQDATSQVAGETPRASVALRVLVVNEPGVAEAISRLRGEWAERSGGTLSATNGNWKEVSTAKGIDADVVVFPSRYLGELCTRDWLLPVRASVLEGEDFKGDDIFPLVRRELMRWGGDVMALPLGVRLESPKVVGAAHPGLALLALAAPNALASQREGVLFDPQNMKPRIADDAFVNALARRANPPASKSVLSEGESAVPVLGFADRLIAVTSSSRNAASAFKLIGWLASSDVSTQLNSPGEQMMPVRRSLASSPAWSGAGQSSNERADAAKELEAALTAERYLLVPRIPGVDEYVAALDDASKAPATDQAAAEAALKTAAERWEQITNSRGRESQQRAYLKHLQIREK